MMHAAGNHCDHDSRVAARRLMICPSPRHDESGMGRYRRRLKPSHVFCWDLGFGEGIQDVRGTQVPRRKSLRI